jgi:hypothetical protein
MLSGNSDQFLEFCRKFEFLKCNQYRDYIDKTLNRIARISSNCL